MSNQPVDMGMGLSFDDVLLVPEKGTALSRDDVDTSVELYLGMKLGIPLISANMDTVTEGKMAEVMEELGGVGIPHRFCLVEEQVEFLKRITDPRKRIVNIGSGECEFNRLEKILLDLDGQVGAVLVDIAHGHSNNVLFQAERIKEKYPHLVLIGGNVATREGAKELVDAGFSVIKAGVGGGAVCSTRVMTGCGVPQLSAIMACREGIDQSSNPEATLIGDGGIKTGGDIVKALAFGADTVMIGSVLSGTDETPGRVVEKDFKQYKLYRGMASRSVIAQRGLKEKVKFVEGVEQWVPLKGTMAPVINKLIDGIKSGMSYLNAGTIRDLRDNVRYYRISANGLRESFPNILL